MRPKTNEIDQQDLANLYRLLNTRFDALEEKLDLITTRIEEQTQQFDTRLRSLFERPLMLAPMTDSTIPSSSSDTSERDTTTTLQPSSASSSTSTTTAIAISTATSTRTIPVYRLIRDHTTVLQVWEEYELGWKNPSGRRAPPVKALEKKYKVGWRKDRIESRYFSRRNVLYRELEKVSAEQDISLQEAANQLEQIRLEHNFTLSALCHHLKRDE